MEIFKISRSLILKSIAEFAFIFLVTILCIFDRQFIVLGLLIVIFILLIISYVDQFSMRYYLDNEFIQFKCITRNVKIRFDEIDHITRLKAGFFVGYSVAVFSGNKSIRITGYTKDGKKLIAEVIKNCKRFEKIIIDNSIDALLD